MEKLEKLSLRDFAQRKFGVGASDKLADEISKIRKVSGQTVRNWFAGRSSPVSREYFTAIVKVWPDVNPHSFFIFDEYSK